MKTKVTKIKDDPIFNFEDKFYTPFDMNTTDIHYIINRVVNNTACISLECSGFCIGKIQIPKGFIVKLDNCKISPATFVNTNGKPFKMKDK